VPGTVEHMASGTAEHTVVRRPAKKLAMVVVRHMADHKAVRTVERTVPDAVEHTVEHTAMDAADTAERISCMASD